MSWRVEVDVSLCHGYANCIAEAPDVFDLGEEDVVVVIKRDGSEGAERVERAALRCPTKAIRVIRPS